MNVGDSRRAGCPRPVAGRSLRHPAFAHSMLTALRHPACAGQQRRLAGHGQPALVRRVHRSDGSIQARRASEGIRTTARLRPTSSTTASQDAKRSTSKLRLLSKNDRMSCFAVKQPGDSRLVRGRGSRRRSPAWRRRRVRNVGHERSCRPAPATWHRRERR